MKRRLSLLALSVLAFGDVARAAEADAGARDPKSDAQGVAVLARGAAKDEAFDVARAIYASSLRPRALDEVRARVLAGADPPANGTRELRELAEVRAAITGEDTASRRLLLGIAQQMHVQALVVVGALGDPEAGPPVAVARVFLADPGEYDAARYEPEAVEGGKPSWRSMVVSLERRFPPPPPPPRVAAEPAATMAPPTLSSEKGDSKPFYLSGWFWGAIAGAALVGGVIFFATRDTADDTIHLQMRVPR